MINKIELSKKTGVAVHTCDSETSDYKISNRNVITKSDYAEAEEKLQSEIFAIMKPSKVIKLYFCFGCERSFAAKKKAYCLAVCKCCVQVATQGKGKIARNNFIEKITNNFQRFLRRRIAQ